MRKQECHLHSLARQVGKRAGAGTMASNALRKSAIRSPGELPGCGETALASLPKPGLIDSSDNAVKGC